jgi:hypothetical protein
MERSLSTPSSHEDFGHMASGLATLVKVGIAVAAVFAFVLGARQLAASVQAPSLGPVVVVSPGGVPSQSPRSGTGPSRIPSPVSPGRHGTPGVGASPLPLPLAGDDDDTDIPGRDTR